MEEATRLRTRSRSTLGREERRAICNARKRDKQTEEGRRLVSVRQQELELLEKRISQQQQQQQRHQQRKSLDAIQEAEAPPTDDYDEQRTPSEASRDYFGESLATLKRATGCEDVADLMRCFVEQRDTCRRLQILRRQTETEKLQKQREVDALTFHLNELKFVHDKDAESDRFRLGTIRTEIDEENTKFSAVTERIVQKRQLIGNIATVVMEIYSCVNTNAIAQDDVLAVLADVHKEIYVAIEKIQAEEQEVDEGETEEKWLPGYYSGLVSRTPVPQQQARISSPQIQQTQGSEEEDEVPSRTYLKRQAQAVVDAKSRRKNVRRT